MSEPQPGVELGHAIFALHDPHPGYEVAFNHWFERDHMYSAAIMAPWTIAGFRYVATKALKDLRYPEDGPFGGPSRRGSFLTAYWIQQGRLDEQQLWVADQMAKLNADPTRTSEHRDTTNAPSHSGRPAATKGSRSAVITATSYDYLGGMVLDAEGVPPELALDRRYPGLVWTVVERTPETPLDDLVRWLLDEPVATAAAGTLTSMVLAFTPRPKPSWWPAAAPEVQGVGDRIMLAHFLDTEPKRIWTPQFAGLGDAIDRSGKARTLLAAPFNATVPGTDRYCDQLW
jgi:hypothetical protein